MNDVSFHTFSPGNAAENTAAAALREVIANEEPDIAWSRMILHRLDGRVSSECIDRYYIAMADGKCVSRLWCGWGKHADAIGNWGHFRTANIMQGKGIGRRLTDRWFEHQQETADGPAAFFCSCAKPFLVRMYGEYGFRLALAGTETGPMYCPLGASPATFQEFCEAYYIGCDELTLLPGTAEYRHEIDCLLYFACQAHGEKFGLPDMPTYETALMLLEENPAAGRLERIVISGGHTVGWAFTPAGGERKIQLHPKYRKADIVEQKNS